jgi:glutamate 5-kinase
MDRRLRDDLLVCGCIYVNAGAEKYAISDTWDLLPVGVVKIDGEFDVGDTVYIKREYEKKIIAKGIVNYSSSDLSNILGKELTKIADKLIISGKTKKIVPVIDRDKKIPYV